MRLRAQVRPGWGRAGGRGAPARADSPRRGAAPGAAGPARSRAAAAAANARDRQALDLCDEATGLFTSYGDLRGADWAAFLRCTLLPHTDPDGAEAGTAAALAEVTRLAGSGHPLRDEKLTGFLEAYRLLLERGVSPEAGWPAWRLGMVPDRHAREVMGVPVPEGPRAAQ
ncbi:hypothetical protein [Streptomyces sp. NPDC059378]|uniref:hypothetical protein n=1 Tax=Streptomyces sp. NPDC059378 TaxID=3346815 RepID=UPI0036A9985D